MRPKKDTGFYLFSKPPFLTNNMMDMINEVGYLP